ncbi:MAG: YvcK family protein [Chloroflexales bacterium]|nr:YvcK family protein [Chloroflexales bacterium]
MMSAQSQHSMSRRSLVAIGGGRGSSQVVLGAQPYFTDCTALVSVTDTGRSTGVARTLADIPAPGDLRNTLATLAHDREALLARLLQYRFRSPAVPVLDGMAFGNLLIAALAQMTGDFAQAIAITSTLVEPTARVLPISTANTQLCAELADGSFRNDELAVRGLNKPPIRRVFLADPAAAYPPALEAIAAANIVVLGPGSFFTSVFAALLFDGVVAALQQTKAMVVFVCNTTTQSGQTDGFRAIDHVARLVDHLGPGVLDVALINRSTGLDSALVAQYAAEGLHLLEPDDNEIAEIAALGVRPLVRDYAEQLVNKREIWNKQDTIRHDPARLGTALWELLQ